MNTQKFVSWNIRGALGSGKRYLIRNLINREHPTMCCLQDTKCLTWSLREISSLGFGSRVGWRHVPAKGFSGGLLTFWNSDCFEIQSHSYSDNWLLIQGSCRVDNSSIACFNVYAPQHSVAKQNLWAHLLQTIKDLQVSFILLLGDFNAVCCISEKVNCNFNKTEAKFFNYFITRSSLLELPLSNASFNWFGPGGKKVALTEPFCHPN